MLRARLSLCLLLVAACQGDEAGGLDNLIADAPPSASSPDSPVPATDAAASAPDAPASAPDAPIATPAPDAPAPSPDAPASACVSARPTVVVSPPTSPPTAAGSQASFDVTVTNNDSLSCPPSSFLLSTRLPDSPFPIVPAPGVPLDSGPLLPGESKRLAITAVPNRTFEGQNVDIPFDLMSPLTFEIVFQGQVRLQVADPAGCNVSVPRSLMMTDVSIVDDPIRTGFDDPTDPRTGVWTFKHLVEEMAPTPAEAPAMVEAMLASFGAVQTINGFTALPRPGFQQQILSVWPRLPNGDLDLRAAPLRLMAIVNRFDLRNLAQGDAGEGRFVFGFVADGFPVEATIIFEFKLPARDANEVLEWAQDMHTMGAIPLSETYNDALQTLFTDRFTRRGARPSGVNGSAVSAVRTNEITFGDDGNWELREFALSAATGMLELRPVDLTPDVSLNGSDTLARYVNANAAAILLDQHVMPDVLEGRGFRGAASVNDFTIWTAPGILDPEARFHFGENTCSGCHGVETGTTFLQIGLRLAGSPSHLSGFLTGKTVTNIFTGEQRTFNDLARRRADLTAVVCPQAGTNLAPASLRRGISRVH